MVGVICFDERGEIKSLNEAAVRLFGYRPEEVAGRGPELLFSRAALAQIRELAARPSGDGPTIESPTIALTGRRRDGAAIDLEIELETIEADGRRHLLGLLQDVSAREQATRAVRESEARLRAIFERAAIGIIRTDGHGRIVEVNQALRRMLGYGALELRGRALADLTHPADAAASRQRLRDLVGGRIDHFKAEERYLRRDGTDLWISALVSAIRGPGGELLFCFGLLEDVTARKEAEHQIEALARTEKLRALGQMASGVAHDLNQYLGLVAGHSELGLAAIAQAEPDLGLVRDSLETMLQAALDGAETVKRLQGFARPQIEGESETIDCGLLLREVARLTAPRWRADSQEQNRAISLEVEVSGRPRIRGWAGSLREAVTNLVFNAVDALPAGGQIRLAAGQVGDRVTIEISDTGTGMSEETREHAFEPFFSTKGDRGTGLGLPIVAGIVERHGGQIAITSRVGQGTAVRLSFVGVEPAPPPPELPVVPARIDGALRILVVDDVPELGRMLSLLLRPGGHQVRVVTSGEEAVVRLGAEPYDLVISDLGMGDGMSGWDLAREVSHHYSHVAFWLTTGWGAEIDPHQARERGVQAVLTKPYRLADLERLLRSMAPSVAQVGPGQPDGGAIQVG